VSPVKRFLLPHPKDRDKTYPVKATIEFTSGTENLVGQISRDIFVANYPSSLSRRSLSDVANEMGFNDYTTTQIQPGFGKINGALSEITSRPLIVLLEPGEYRGSSFLPLDMGTSVALVGGNKFLYNIMSRNEVDNEANYSRLKGGYIVGESSGLFDILLKQNNYGDSTVVGLNADNSKIVRCIFDVGSFLNVNSLVQSSKIKDSSLFYATGSNAIAVQGERYGLTNVDIDNVKFTESGFIPLRNGVNNSIKGNTGAAIIARSPIVNVFGSRFRYTQRVAKVYDNPFEIYPFRYCMFNNYPNPQMIGDLFEVETSPTLALVNEYRKLSDTSTIIDLNDGTKADITGYWIDSTPTPSPTPIPAYLPGSLHWKLY